MFLSFTILPVLMEKNSLNQIIQKHNVKMPPTGAGDCCAPKLLNYAFSHQLQIVSMDEIYFSPQYRSS